MIEGNSVPEPNKKIEEVESKDRDAAKKEKEDLAALEEELTESSFPPGCSWECYLANHPRLAKKIENTEEAALDHWMNGRQKGIRWDCTCKEGTLIEGKPQPELEEEVINAMIVIEEELEGKDDNAANIEKEDLEPLAAELIEPNFPSGCSWECYLANHPRVAKEIEYTEAAALEHYLKYANRKKAKWDCTCQEGTVKKEQTRPKQDETREQKKKKKLEKREQNQQVKQDTQKQSEETNVMGYVSGTLDMKPMSDGDKGYKFVDRDEVHVYVDDDERRQQDEARQQKKKKKLEKREQNQQVKRDKQKQSEETNVMGYVSGTPDMKPMLDGDKGYTFVDRDEVHVYVDDDERRRHLRLETREEERR